MNLDFKNTVFVIDSPVIAMIVAIIAEQNPIDIIYEFKIGIDDPDKLTQAYDEILGNNNIKQRKIFTVPSPYFLVSKRNPIDSIARVYRFQKAINSIDLNRKTYYCGPITSSIMKRITRSHMITIDHGSGEYAKRMRGINRQTVKEKIFQTIISLFGLYSLNTSVSTNGFTLCKIFKDNYTHVDYRKYMIPDVIAHTLYPIKQKLKYFQDISLVNPISAWHSKNGFDPNTTKYNSHNLNMIGDHCAFNEFILIKFHPTVYYAKDPVITLPDVLNMSGYNCFDIDSQLPVHLRGNLPAEIIVQFLNVNKIVAELSATMFNVAHNTFITNISAALDLNQVLDRKNYVINHICEINTGIMKHVQLPQSEA